MTPSGTDHAPEVEIDGYRDFDLIGTGGFSRVYRAFQEAYHRKVAVKVLTVGDMDERGQRRFRRECSVTGRLTGHPHIVTVLDSGFTTAGRPYLTMEFFAKGSMATRLQREGPIDLASTLEIGVKLAGALETAHRAGILHRDIKPQNILVSGFGEPALADFGISQLSATDVSATTDTLTPIHAAPEVINANESSPGSDIYSLGSTLYCLLAGRAPFAKEGEEGIMALLLRILREPLPPLGLGVETDQYAEDLLRRSMEKDPAHRFAASAEFGEALQGLQSTIGAPVTPLLYPSDDDAPDRSDAADEPAGQDPPAGGGATEDRLVVSMDEDRTDAQGDEILTVDFRAPADPVDTIKLRPHLPPSASR